MNVLVLILAFAVTGCAAYERSNEATQAKSRMVGLRDDQVRECAGKPTSIERRGETEIWNTNPAARTPAWANSRRFWGIGFPA